MDQRRICAPRYGFIEMLGATQPVVRSSGTRDRQTKGTPAPVALLERQATLWAERGQSQDLLLRGLALAEAECWAATHEDELTDEQRDLLEESRALCASEERLRAHGDLVRVLACAAALLTILALQFAYRSRVEGQAQLRSKAAAEADLASIQASLEAADAVATRQAQVRRDAETAHAQADLAAAMAESGRREGLARTRAAESSALAAWAHALADGQPELALLLALESVRRTPFSGAGGAKAQGPSAAAVFRALGQPHWEDIQADQATTVGRGWRSPTGRIVAAAADGRVCVWDARTGTRVTCLDGANDHLRHAAWSHDGRRVLAGDGVGPAGIWDAETGQRLLTLSGRVGCAAWSPDDLHLITCGSDCLAILWDGRNGRRLGAIHRLSAPATHIRWESTDPLVTVHHGDGDSTVFDARTGIEVSVTRDGNAESVGPYIDEALVSIGFLTTSDRVFVVSPADLLDMGCAQATRNLTRAEWERYVGDSVPYRATCPGLP